MIVYWVLRITKVVSLQDEAPCIPYGQALRDHEEARNSAQLREALLQQLRESREQLVAAEQDRERWKQELQLLQLRYQEVP